MFENNPLQEPRTEFDRNKSGYINYTNKTEQLTKIQKLEQPFGFVHCLNVKQHAEFALMDWLQKIPGSAEAQTLLNYIMLTQDYMFDTASMEPGYADERENERAEELFQQTK